MALETTTYIDGLNSSNPLSTDSVSQADDHIRLIKAAIKATFPNITGPVTATQGQLNSPIPTGVIVMWSGAAGSIPSGWYLCNGSNGTPDLRNRFIVGAGSSYAVGDIGGAASVSLTVDQIPSHNHDITATAASSGSHVHSITDPGHIHGSNITGSGITLYGGPGYSSSSVVAYTGITINAAGLHTHNIAASSATTGGGQAHENRPPYYALAFIMKA